MSEAFDAALARLYEAFAAPTPKAIFGCPCCLNAKQADVLLAKSLRELTAVDLGSYAADVFLTVGDVSDFRYLLPRILEIAAHDPNWWPTPEVAVGKLRLADWSGWREVERQAVVDVLSAWFNALIRGEPQSLYERPFGEVDALLCGIARADLDIEPYLERLKLPDNARGLASLLEDHPLLYGDRDFLDSFWEDAPEAAKIFQAFVAEHT